MNPEFWNVLHDGFITGVSGSVPGDVQLGVEIDYLRQRFADPGDRIVLTLHGCTALSYHPFDEVPVTDFTVLAQAKPQILRAKDWTDASLVECAAGDLRITATGAALALDNGRPLSLEELGATAGAYWAEWSERSAKANPSGR
mgnify:CR=1 FL=1